MDRANPPPVAAPDLVIFIGIQATGKSTFYRERFAATHVHISLDLLKHRNREARLFAECLEHRRNAVIDNTNPARADRQRYLVPALAAGFRVRGFYFQSKVADALARNAGRAGAARIPDVGVRSCAGRLQRPSLDEGFAELAFVAIQAAGSSGTGSTGTGFLIQPWQFPDQAPGQ
jgi:hypothetical protein